MQLAKWPHKIITCLGTRTKSKPAANPNPNQNTRSHETAHLGARNACRGNGACLEYGG